MASTKVTFTLDDLSIAHLADAARRLARPRSEIVRLAIDDYYQNLGRLSHGEKLKLLRAFDELVPLIPQRSAAEVRREIQSIRNARRAGGRVS